MDDKGNIYFHFNPRPQEKCLIINACLNGNWGKEERKFVQKFPFLPMQYFEASFVLMEDKFTVSKMWKFLNCKAMISFYEQWVILDILHLLLFTISCTFRCSWTMSTLKISHTEETLRTFLLWISRAELIFKKLSIWDLWWVCLSVCLSLTRYFICFLVLLWHELKFYFTPSLSFLWWK